MIQPFCNECSTYSSPLWPELLIQYAVDHVVIQSKETFEVLSNAPYNGGLSKGNKFVNWKVPLNYDCTDPASMMETRLKQWGYNPASTVGLQTAAHIKHTSFAEETGDEFKLLVCASSGTGNAVRAGLERETFSAYELGTINIIILIDGRLTSSAMVNAVISATEAKSAVFEELRIRDQSYDCIATGTSTDAVLIAVSQSNTYEKTHRYAGAVTTIGNAIGRLVYAVVHETIRTQGE